MEGQITIAAKPRMTIDYQKPKAALTLETKMSASITIGGKLAGDIKNDD